MSVTLAAVPQRKQVTLVTSFTDAFSCWFLFWNNDIKLRTAFTTPYFVSEAPSMHRVSKGVTFTSAGFAASCVVLSKKYLWCGSLELPCREVNDISQAFQFPTGLLYPSIKQMQRRRFSHATLVFAYKWRICYRAAVDFCVLIDIAFMIWIGHWINCWIIAEVFFLFALFGYYFLNKRLKALGSSLTMEKKCWACWIPWNCIVKPTGSTSPW